MRRSTTVAVNWSLAALGLMVGSTATARAGLLDPLAFQPLAASFPGTPGTYTINTSGAIPTLTGPSGSGISVSGVLSPDGSTAVFDFGSINIGAGDLILASGSRPVALLAQQGMIVGGTIDGSGAPPLTTTPSYPRAREAPAVEMAAEMPAAEMPAAAPAAVV
jgi:hypothetical protein